MQEHTHVVAALRRKRAEVSGRLEHTVTEVQALRIELDHLDATIRIFDPNIDIAGIRPKPLPPPHYAHRGQVQEPLYDALERASKPLSTAALAVCVMRARGLNVDDPGLRLLIRRRTVLALGRLREKGVIESVPGPGKGLVWSMRPRQDLDNHSLPADGLLGLERPDQVFAISLR